jgi:hypothetical protein
MGKSKNKPVVDNDKWVRSHFSMLVRKFGGQHLVLAQGCPYIGLDVAELFKQARRNHPGIKLLSMPIPRPEDFVSVLRLWTK